MARPRRKELSYITVDCKLDRKIQLLEAKHGLIGFAIWIKLLQKIYGDEGYFMRWTEDDILLFADDNHVKAEKVTLIVDDCIRRGIFDEEQFRRNGILTSHGIQSRYLFACASRSGEKIRPEYALVECAQIVSEQETPVSGQETPVSEPEMPHTIPYQTIPNNTIQNDTIRNETTSTGNNPKIWENYPESDGGGGGLTSIATRIMYDFFRIYGWNEQQQDIFERTLTEQKGCDDTGKPIRNLERYMAAWDAKFKTGFIF